MFYMLKLKRRIQLQPKELGRGIADKIRRALIREVEGTCDQNGYIIALLEITHTGAGKIDELSGAVSFQVEYQALIFRPEKGEVCDGVCLSVSQHAIIVQVGPAQVLVPPQMIPEEMKFDNSQTPMFANEDRSLKITRGTELRIQIFGTKFMGTSINALGSIQGDYLGPIG
eukprot:EC799080.1.p1 GENE.EC799080.1~~EC799080.1.p1  ORF type:complete len:171 (+),score=57.09 EC799080.1:90-602(+)